ncbi:MAG: Unknown protein [uncultured Thiotrichaceae bacterium]|uniref:Crocagin biosynthetic protein CgnE/B domain-containing protein n=1 Tax=uncultured Thiotrichaceae bacterium TaxID=298394 RepID=A0A6S6U261_9GAMM|nr:MAG: Unknown protein [uncultured Thiotrichaceae bacterium]
MKTHEFLNMFRERKLLVITDDNAITDLFRKHGFTDFADFADFDFAANTDPVFVLLSTYPSQYRMNKELWDNCGGIFVHLAAAKFDGSLQAVDYSIQKILDIPDYAATLAHRDVLYEKALSAKLINIHSGENSVLTGVLAEEVEVANYDAELEEGWLYSIAEFFETSIVNLADNKSSFCVDGKLVFNGLSYLENSPELKTEFAPLLTEMVNLSVKGDNWLECQDNSITKMVLGGQDFTAKMNEAFADSIRGLSLTEFAFGVVNHPKMPDWRINSIMNEGIVGMHVGIGIAVDTSHVDFISAGARLEFVH